MIERALVLIALVAIGAALKSVAFEPPRPLEAQPFPDAHEYADGARKIAQGHGFVTTVHGDAAIPPRYPPGYSLALSPFATLGDYPDNVQRAAKVYVLLYVVIAAIAAWILGGPVAAALVAAMIATSPFARESGTLVMSDALVAALTVATLPFLRVVTPRSASAAGALSGAVVVVRLTAAVNLPALIAALPRRFWKRAILFALPPLIGLGIFQWITMGSPLTTGYSYWGFSDGAFDPSFAFASPPRGDGPFIVADRLDGELMNWVCPCPFGGPQSALASIYFYPLVLLGAFWIYAPPLATLPGLYYAIRRHREPVCRFTLTVTVLTLLSLVFFFSQGARFMAPPVTLLMVLSGVAIAGWLERGAGHAFGYRNQRLATQSNLE